MRNARAHKLQWSGPTVHSSIVLERLLFDTADVCLSTVIRLFLASLLPYVYLQLASRVHTVCSI